MASRNKQILKAAVGIVLAAVWCVFIFQMSAKGGEVSQGMSDGVIASAIKLLYPGFVSLNPDAQVAAIGTWSFPVRKAAHLSEYALLGLLASNACIQLARARGREVCLRSEGKRLLLLAFALCVLYAASDEFHQLFVDGRSGQLRDVVIDSCGAMIGVLVARAALLHKG